MRKYEQEQVPKSINNNNIHQNSNPFWRLGRKKEQ